jgi:hypothetical protein
MSSILHGENSTAKAEWHPNPTTRGTWNIYQTCIVCKCSGELCLRTVTDSLVVSLDAYHHANVLMSLKTSEMLF